MQPKISMVSTLGPALSICGYCRKVVGKTTVLLSLADSDQENSETFNEPTRYCQCVEKALLGATYEQR